MIAFFELVKAFPFSSLFSFLGFSYKTIYIFETFSLDLYTYKLNISRMWVIKALLLLKMESLLVKSRIPKMAFFSVKVGKIKLFWKHWTKCDHQHVTRSHWWICQKVFRRINYRKMEIEMRWRWLYFKSMKFFLLRNRTLFKFCTQQIACRYYRQ